ncbi:MAG TPA: hypothetical protein ENN29_03505 [Candidatus Hydrogenedentes bacterium]|nr:hypothetical protein [Candidatus Hydrogenedentota bacterium]
MRAISFCVALFLGVSIVNAGATAAPALLYDFTEGMRGWTGNPRVTNMKITDEGLYFESGGVDPWIESPRVQNMPLGDRVRLTLRMKSTGDRSGQIFYGAAFAAARSASFLVTPDGAWHEYTLLLPPQERDTRLRLDPAQGEGAFTVAWIKAEALRPLITTDFKAPKPVVFDKTLEVAAESLSLRHNGRDWDGYALYVDDELMAMGHADATLGFMVDGRPVMFSLRDAAVTAAINDAGALTVEANFTDPGGAVWKLTRSIKPHSHANTLRTVTTVMAEADREVCHLPWLTLFPGMGSFGERKTQALLPGVEYLEDEPSSSAADFNAAQADRRIVEDYKLTLPMMALSHEGRYIGVVWNRADKPAAVFDSPDRVFHSGAHLMGLWHPGVGDHRLENEMAVYSAFTLPKNTPLQLEMFFLGGHGDSMVPAAQHYIALRGLPELPGPSLSGLELPGPSLSGLELPGLSLSGLELPGLSLSGLSRETELVNGFDHAVRLLAAGWLDSDAHVDGLWRHAVWGDNFPPQPAADAPAYMLWLAAHIDDDALATRLSKAAARGLTRLNPADNYLASVSHVSRPTPVLLFGSIENNVERMVAAARAGLNQFDAQGLRRYHQPDPNRPDYGRTHFADHANGYNAQALEPILAAAAFSGDTALAEAALRLLDKQTAHYANTVPRGAQTWEMPLHTPDILAAARLIRAYVLGYLLSGCKDYLEQARYWAWTGVPLLYLDHPVEGPVGAYATIAVLGATNWAAPNWIGQPVQWCGLVYRSALHDLAALDNEEGAFWNKVAKGITISGLQQTFPLDDEARRGLLPDFFHLREQVSDGPAISPGTVQAHLHEVYGKTAYYTAARLNEKNALIHAPGGIDHIAKTGGVITVRITGWNKGPYWVRITGATPSTRAGWRNKPSVESDYDKKYNALNLRIEGSGILTLKGM